MVSQILGDLAIFYAEQLAECDVPAHPAQLLYSGQTLTSNRLSPKELKCLLFVFVSFLSTTNPR
jgi:hypothetical protein